MFGVVVYNIFLWPTVPKPPKNLGVLVGQCVSAGGWLCLKWGGRGVFGLGNTNKGSKGVQKGLVADPSKPFCTPLLPLFVF